jgi:hypothetical protein
MKMWTARQRKIYCYVMQGRGIETALNADARLAQEKLNIKIINSILDCIYYRSSGGPDLFFYGVANGVGNSYSTWLRMPR